MQCFTRGHKYPKTTLRHDYSEPPPSAYKKRPFFKPEPTVIGRTWCPGAVPAPAPWNYIKRLQYDPVDFIYRESHMNEMMEHINKTNWTCGGDIESLGPRRSKPSESINYSLQSTMRADYQDPGLGKPFLRNPARNTWAEGATPGTYHLIPFKKPDDHWLLQPIKFDQPEPEFNPKIGCKFTVPHYMPLSYPGPALPPDWKSSLPDKKIVTKMGVVK